MIDSVARRLEKEGAQFAQISVESNTYVVFALPYSQLEKPPQGYAFIDSYYVASNRAYFLRKELAALLEKEGYTTFACEHSYKHVAVAAGLGFWLRSTLVANAEFGTRFAMEIVGVEGVFAREISLDELYTQPAMHERCTSCKICERLCPQQCLHGGRIEYERCTRYAQENGKFSDDAAARAAGANLWGCDVCQRCCPFNKHSAEQKMDEGQEKLYRLESLYDAFSAGKKGCEPYREMLGGNYLRPSKLLALTLNVMANSPNTEQYLPMAKKAKNHPDERVRIAAERLEAEALRSINDK